MDGNGGAATVDDLVSTLQRTVSCVTRAVLVRSRSQLTAASFIGFPERLIPLQSAEQLSLSVLHAYEERTEGGGTRTGRAQTTGYWYHLHQRGGREVVAFHWHPELPVSVSFAHLHVDGRSAAPALDRRRHVPTGRVSLEAVVRFAIEEIGVRPFWPDWRRVLGEGIASFDAGRSW